MRVYGIYQTSLVYFKTKTLATLKHTLTHKKTKQNKPYWFNTKLHWWSGHFRPTDFHCTL